jgi:hypothetical protein
MFQIVVSGANRIDITFGGKLDSDEMRTALDELVETTRGIERGQILYRIEDFDFPTLGAIGVELSRLPELFRMIGKFRQVAVLCDKRWVQKASEIEGALFPGLEIKAFDLDDEVEAEAWLASQV